MSPVRAVVIDDSPTMRGLISATLRRDPDIQVIGMAGDPLEARQVIKELNPDVITLDIEMPNMSGLEFLEKIMRLRPMPVVMVSTLTQKGADATLQALELGAVDCVGKPTGGAGSAENFTDLADRVKSAARATVRPLGGATRPVHSETRANYVPSGDLVAIGSSTGGVEALLEVIRHFPANCPPTVITQHMPPTFTKSFAARLDRATPASVEEAYDGAPLSVGKIYLAPGGERHLHVIRAGGLKCRLVEGDLVSGHRPSVDAMFQSVLTAVGGKAVCGILTGMGRDGAAGMKALRDAGARTIGQDEASCVVYGMPKMAFEYGGVERQLPLTDIGPALITLAEKRR